VRRCEADDAFCFATMSRDKKLAMRAAKLPQKQGRLEGGQSLI
jgi:hypothetical protein